MSRGRQNFAGQKRHGFLLCPRGTELFRRLLEIMLQLPGLLGLAGVPLRKSGAPAGDKKYPADFGRQNFAAPWTTRKVIFLAVFFHIFPFQRGKPDIFYGINLKGLSSLGKREDGRDFWKGLFSRLNSYETEEKNQKKPGKNQKFIAPKEYR